METPTWYGQKDYNYFSSNAPPVIDIARDMAAAVSQWSSADMDFLVEVNDDVPKSTSTPKYRTQQNNFTNMVSENIVGKNIRNYNTGIEYSYSGEESVFIAREELVISDSGLCVKNVQKSTNPPTEDVQSNVGKLQHDFDFPTYNFNQIQCFKPFLNLNPHTQYGYIENPPVLQNPPAMYYQHTDDNFVDWNVNYQYNTPAVLWPQNTLYGSALIDYTVVPEVEQNVISVDNGEEKDVGIEHPIKSNGQTNIDVNTCRNGFHIHKDIQETATIAPGNTMADSGASQGQRNERESITVEKICSKDKSVTCKNIKTNGNYSINRAPPSREPVNVSSGSITHPFSTGIQTLRVDKFGNHFNNAQGNQFNHVLVPFDPSVPPPPILSSMSRKIPQKMLLYDQSKPATSFRNVAEATTPGGHKFYIPLDESRYEVKKSRHNLYCMPRGCDFQRLESEGEFESSVQLGFSPRPVQFKGSLSEDDGDSSDESVSSDTSQTTRISAIPSISEDRLVQKHELVPDKDISCGNIHVDEANTNVKENLDVAIECEIPDSVEKSVNIDEEGDDNNCEIPSVVHLNEELKNSDNEGYPEAREDQDTFTNTKSNTTAYCFNSDEYSVGNKSDYAPVNGVDNVANCAPENGIREELHETYLADIHGTALKVGKAIETAQNQEQIIQSSYTEAEIITSDEQNSAFMNLGTEDQHSWYQSPIAMDYVNSQQFMAPQIYDQPPVAHVHEYPVFTDINQQYNQHIPVPYYCESNINQDGNNTATKTGESQKSIPQELFNPDDGLPYPALHISNDGLITVILRHGVYVEMTTEKAIRVVSHEKKLVVAFNDVGNRSCVIHPAARIYQSDSNIDAELSLNRKAKMTSSSIVFGNTFKTYKFDYTSINEVVSFNEFRCLNEDLSINFLDTNTGFFNSDVLLRCSELITRAYFEKQGDTGCKVIINGTKIVQNESADVMVYSGSIRYIRMSPITNVIRLRTQFMELDIETNWNLKLQRGTHTLNSSHLGFILSNGKIKASIDQKNQMDAFSLPYYRRLYLNEPVPHRRPGVAPRRRYIRYNRRCEPEFDHRAYTRH